MGFFTTENLVVLQPQWIPWPPGKRETNALHKVLSRTNERLKLKTLHRNNAASLWSLRDGFSVSTTSVNGATSQAATPPPPPPLGPRSTEGPEALLWAPAVQESESLHPCGLLEVFFSCVVAVVVYRRKRLGSFQLARHFFPETHPASSTRWRWKEKKLRMFCFMFS